MESCVNINLIFGEEKMQNIKILAIGMFLMLLVPFLSGENIYAHCDGIKGPVVSSAKKALETGNVNYALIWVSADNEKTIKNLFSKALEVRRLNDNARELADMYFFETLVRLHRSGEGEPYTGVKFTDKDVPPVLHAADKAIETGDQAELLKYFKSDKDKKAVQNRLKEVLSKKQFSIDDLKAGRSYVRTYTDFIHYAAELSGEKEIEGQHKKEHKVHG